MTSKFSDHYSVAVNVNQKNTLFLFLTFEISQLHCFGDTERTVTNLVRASITPRHFRSHVGVCTASCHSGAVVWVDFLSKLKSANFSDVRTIQENAESKNMKSRYGINFPVIKEEEKRLLRWFKVLMYNSLFMQVIHSISDLSSPQEEIFFADSLAFLQYFAKRPFFTEFHNKVALEFWYRVSTETWCD